jgi:hypothetical protein
VARHGTTPKSVVMSRLMAAAFCDAVSDNTEPFHRYFTRPTYDAATGVITLQTVRQKGPDRYERVTWAVQVVAVEGERKPIKEPFSDVVPQDGRY